MGKTKESVDETVVKVEKHEALRHFADAMEPCKHQDRGTPGKKKRTYMVMRAYEGVIMKEWNGMIEG